MNDETKSRTDKIRALLDEARDALEELRDDLAHGFLPDDDGIGEYFADAALTDVEGALDNLGEMDD